jgi:uncharacterized membrane protein
VPIRNSGLRPGIRVTTHVEQLMAELALFTLSSVLHVATAIVLVGGTFFVRFILLPAAAANLPDDLHAKLRQAVSVSWKKIVHLGIALFIITGAINYYRIIALGGHKGDALYHALLGTKMILALVVFFIASALVGRSAAFEGMRRNPRRWLLVNLLLAGVIVAVSGFLKVRDVPAGKSGGGVIDR